MPTTPPRHQPVRASLAAFAQLGRPACLILATLMFKLPQHGMAAQEG